MRSPIGEGTLRGFPPLVLIVAELGLSVKGAAAALGGLTTLIGEDGGSRLTVSGGGG